MLTESIIVRPRTGRGPYRDAPDPAPSCPGCSRPFASVIQPDPARPAALLGVCTNPGCSEWVVLAVRDSRPIVAERIPPERRRPAPAARHAAIATAAV